MWGACSFCSCLHHYAWSIVDVIYIAMIIRLGIYCWAWRSRSMKPHTYRTFQYYSWWRSADQNILYVCGFIDLLRQAQQYMICLWSRVATCTVTGVCHLQEVALVAWWIHLCCAFWYPQVMIWMMKSEVHSCPLFFCEHMDSLNGVLVLIVVRVVSSVKLVWTDVAHLVLGLGSRVHVVINCWLRP